MMQKNTDMKSSNQLKQVCFDAKKMFEKQELKVLEFLPYSESLKSLEKKHKDRASDIINFDDQDKAVFFWKALQDLFHGEKKEMDKKIAALWHNVMIRPCLLPAVKHGHARADKRNSPQIIVRDQEVERTAMMAQRARRSLTSKMFGIRPKFAEIKYLQSDSYRTRISGNQDALLQNEKFHDTPVQEMAKVQARFSDLIF